MMIFADYLAVTKGMYAFVGTHNPAEPNTGFPIITACLTLDENGLLICLQCIYMDYALWVCRRCKNRDGESRFTE